MAGTPLVKALYATQIFSGALSFTASTIIAIMILCSDVKLSHPFQRIIFALSVSDMIQSLASVIGPFASIPTPEGSSFGMFNVGNQTSCNIQGVMMMSGGTLCAFYTLSICIFFLCVVKYQMPNKVFARTVEWKLHSCAVAFSFGTSIAYLALGLYNNLPDGNMCFVKENPGGCHKSSTINCERGQNAADYILYMTMIPLMVIFVGINLSLSNLWLYINGELRSAHSESRNDNSSFHENIQSIVLNLKLKLICCSCLKGDQVSPPNPVPANTRRGEHRATRYRRESFMQSISYVGGFLFVYSWPMITYFGFYRAGKDQPIGFTIVTHFFFPLQGVLNVYIYTMTKVSALQNRHPDMTWFKCFLEIVKAGGEIPEENQRWIQSRGLVSRNVMNSRRLQIARGDPSTLIARGSLELINTIPLRSTSGPDEATSNISCVGYPPPKSLADNQFELDCTNDQNDHLSANSIVIKDEGV